MEILESYLCAKVTAIGLRELPIETFFSTLLLADTWQFEGEQKPQTNPASNNHKNTPNKQKKEFKS